MRNPWLHRLPWIALVVVVLGALAWVVVTPKGMPSSAQRTRTIASQLRCLECQGLSVADSRTTTAEAIKADIRRRVDAGESDAEIKRAYVDRYGEYILLEPSNSNSLLWLLPVLIVVIGVGGIAFVVLRNARAPRMRATDDDRAVVAAARNIEERA